MPSSSFLHQLGMCQKYHLILPPSLFKRFYPLREDLKGIPYITELISSPLPTARFWWEQEPTLSSQAPTALPGEPLGTAGGQAGAIPYSQRQGSWSLCPNPECCHKPLLFPSHFSFFPASRVGHRSVTLLSEYFSFHLVVTALLLGR